MKRSLLVPLVPLGILMLVQPGTALGQQPYARPATAPAGYARPAYSPYLNLLRFGSSPAINYYGLVRPQEDFSSSISQLQYQDQTLQQSVTGLQTAATLPTTGHPSQFQNYTKYFQNLNGPQPLANRATIGSRPPIQSGIGSGGRRSY